MQNARNIIQTINERSAHHYKRFDEVVFERAEGVWLYGTDGKKYLDMLSTYSAVGVGNNHPRIKSIFENNLPIAGHTHYTLPEAELLERLTKTAGMDCALLMNTGAEAVEAAIKLARKWAYKKKGVLKGNADIVVVSNNFHGRTTTVISFSTEEKYKEYFGPHTPGFTAVPFGDIKALSSAIRPNTAAVLMEPIQGEGGVIVPPPEYLRQVQRVCNENNVLFMLDEIQTGFGRTGRMFCFERYNAKPDVLIVGKALGGGVYPVSGVLANEEIMRVFEPGDHGSTWGGNALACAIANETLKILNEENLVNNSSTMGAYLRSLLSAMAAETPLITEIRGRGLLVGVELAPEAGDADELCAKLLERGIVCKGAHSTVLRLAPPLTIQKEHIEYFIRTFKEVLHQK